MRLTINSVALVLLAFAGAVAVVTACATPVINEQPANNQKMNDETSAPSNNAPASTPEAVSSEQKLEGLDFKSEIRLERQSGKPRLIINYTLTNQGTAAVLVFNQGDVSNPGPATVYVEPQADGVVEISKKGFMPPENPGPTYIIYPGATTLAAGKSISDKIELTLAYLTRRHPYAASASNAAMPNPVKKVRFCLGVSAAQGVKTKTAGEGKRKILVPDMTGLARQQVLCSEVQEIQ